MEPLLIALIIAVAILVIYVVRRHVVHCNRQQYPLREIQEFLSAEECEHIISLAKPLIIRSSVVRKGNTNASSILRTSGTAFFTNTNDAVIKRVKKRIAELTDIDLRCQEPLQVTHYNPSEFYAPHRDAMGPGVPEFEKTGDRHCTVIIYLNDDFSGGYTRFNKLATRIKPEQGKAVLFYNLTEDGEHPHPLSVHSAEPVSSGEKWLLNQWIRQRHFTGQENRKAKREKSKKKKTLEVCWI